MTTRAPGTQWASVQELKLVGTRPSLHSYLSETIARRAFLREHIDARIEAESSSSHLGPLWLLGTPLLNAALFFIVFGVLLGANKNVENYPLFLLTGVLLWVFASKSITSATTSLRKQRDFVRTIPFPRILIVLSSIGVEVRHLAWSLLVLAGVAILSCGISITWLASIGAVALLIALVTGIGLLCARLASTVPDVVQLLPFVLRAGAFLSGVYFPLTNMTQMGAGAKAVGQWLSYNPIAVALNIARDGLSGQWPPASDWTLLISCSAVALLLGVWAFWRGEPKYGR